MPKTACEVIYIIGLLVGSVIRGVYTRHYRKLKIAVDRKSTLEMALLMVPSVGLVFLPLVYFFSPWLDFADYRLPVSTRWMPGVTGTVLFAAALWLLWRSHVDLGRNWTPVPQIRKEHSLVTGGVYRHIRHPMYAAHWLWAIAQVLLLPNWMAGPALLVTFPAVYFVRVPVEERMMLEHFGDEYRAYMNQTGRLIPRY